MISLRTIERRGVAFTRLVAGQRLDRSEEPEGVAELPGEPGRSDGRPESTDGDDRRPGRGNGQTSARLQLDCKRSRDRDGETRVAVHERIEDVGVQLEQHAVPNRLHCCRSRGACEQCKLADRGAGAELADGTQAVLVVDENPEPPAPDEEHPIRRIPLPDDDLAGVHLDRSEALRELRQRLVIRTRQERNAREELVLCTNVRLNAHAVAPGASTRPARRPRQGGRPALASP